MAQLLDFNFMTNLKTFCPAYLFLFFNGHIRLLFSLNYYHTSIIYYKLTNRQKTSKTYFFAYNIFLKRFIFFAN